MVVVKLEIWPGGDELKMREIGRAHIANISNLADVSDYSVILFGGIYGRLMSGIWRRGTVKGFDRKRRGAWDLLLLALEATVGGRR